MTTPSSYLAHLPPVLWDRPNAPDALPLGAVLRVFEKILSGIDDGVVVAHGAHAHEGLEQVIARLHHLFDPRTTRSAFLDYLASWVALRFPGLDVWDEYQRRKTTAGIVQVYRERGLKSGLDRFLDLYTVSATRPRIVVDDASKVLVLRLAAGRFAPIDTLVSQRPLVTPTCIARAPDGSLLVGDLGPGGAGEEAVWRLLPDGQPPFAGGPPEPKPVGPPGWNLVQPIAVATDAGTPWTLWVLDRVLAGALPALYALSSTNLAVANTVATRAALGTAWPVAMARDPVSGHLLVLDRGGAGVAAPFILDVTPSPFAVVKHAMPALIEPLSIAVLPNGDLLVGDGREQAQSGANPPGTPLPPGNLVRVTRGVAWTATVALDATPNGANPLVAPMALAVEDADHVLVADLGLKPLQGGGTPYEREVAEPASVYRARITAPLGVVRVAETKQLVVPTGMVRDVDTLILTDRGESGLIAGVLREWRARPHEFGVVVHYSLQRPVSPEKRRRIGQDVREFVDVESPAHAKWTLVAGV